MSATSSFTSRRSHVRGRASVPSPTVRWRASFGPGGQLCFGSHSVAVASLGNIDAACRTNEARYDVDGALRVAARPAQEKAMRVITAYRHHGGDCDARAEQHVWKLVAAPMATVVEEELAGPTWGALVLLGYTSDEAWHLVFDESAPVSRHEWKGVRPFACCLSQRSLAVQADAQAAALERCALQANPTRRCSLSPRRASCTAARGPSTSLSVKTGSRGLAPSTISRSRSTRNSRRRCSRCSRVSSRRSSSPT